MENNELQNLKQAILASAKGDYRLTVVPVIGSTNMVLRTMAREGAPEGTVLVAEQQTAGRGRMGRAFFSPSGSGLYFSVLLRPSLAVDALKITVAAGVAVARAVKEVCNIELKIKWVNDLYLADKKVCGILAEGALNPTGGLEWCVLGIGINVFSPQAGFGDLQNIAGALLTGEPNDALRGQLAAAVLDRFFELYQNMDEPALLREYRERSYLQGKTVTAVQGKKRVRGTVVGIGDGAELLLQTVSGEQLAFSSGEVQLEDYR